jgi:hypothetical protein
MLLANKLGTCGKFYSAQEIRTGDYLADRSYRLHNCFLNEGQSCSQDP